MKTILIIEDEHAIAQVLRVYLEKAPFNTKIVSDGRKAMDTFSEIQPDLVLLDIMLPGKSGWEILQEIRKQSNCPIIMLTALSDVQHRLTGLNDGADDYISKPFVGEEVVARVHAVLRRFNQRALPIREFGSLVIYHEAHRTLLHGKELALTPRDTTLLIFLSAYPNQTFTREQLIEQVWGWDYDGSDRAVDLSIKRLRKALQSWPKEEGEIKTIRGLGYQFRVQTN